MMNSIEKVWKNFMNDCLKQGKWVIKDDGDKILEIIDNHCFIENVVSSVMGENELSLELFLNLIGKGKFNINGYPIKDEALKHYVLQLDDDKQIFIGKDSRFNQPYTYPERLFNIHQATRNDNIVDENQVDTIIKRLKEHNGSNRAVANLYMCSLDKDEQHIPCLQFIQCLIRDNELSLHILFRSNDLFGAFCSNMMFLMYLGLKITNELKQTYPSLKFAGLYYNSTSLHIYQGDYEQALKVKL